MTALIQLNGGLGNQLFQIAATYAYAKKHNKTPMYITNNKIDYSKTYLSNITFGDKLIKYPRYNEKDFCYNEIPFYKKSICLNGYFQSWKYFDKYKEEIKNLFKSPTEITPPNTVAVHIRRGDYVKLSDYHYNQDIKYYQVAKDLMIDRLGKDIRFMYFSDDIEWVKQNFQLGVNDSIIKMEKDYDEFLMMQSCHHFIISNSTFSWWAAYLSKSTNKIVIAPSKWFGPKGPKNWQDIYLPDWIVISDYKNNYFESILEDNRINIHHKYWRDDIIINDDMLFNRHSHKAERGFLFIDNGLKLLWDNYHCETSIDFISIKGNMNRINDIQLKSIENRITKIKGDNPYDLYLINLDHRKDRMNNFLENSKTQPFNIFRFSAIKHPKGAVGCGLSHLSLIKYAKEKQLQYVIVAEDDAIFKIETKSIIEKLVNNLDKWNIFNGAPSFWDKRDDIYSIKISDSFTDELLNIEWGQSTSFMIYNSSVYDTILNYNFEEHIDQFISKNFRQTIMRNKPFSIQAASYSDNGSSSQDKEYENYFINQYRIVDKLLQVKRKSIGIYGIFMGKYQVFYKDFIANIEANFYPNIKKYYYIVTDNSELPLYNDRTFVYNTEMIGWPYSTLYRFIYFLQFKKEDIELSEAIFFVNSNGKFLEKIYSPIVNEELFFTYHSGFVNKKYSEISYEKNSVSNAYIPYDKANHYEYFAGGFHGGETSAFVKMCEILSERIFEDERKGYIALWHDESHINRYCYELKKEGKKFGVFDDSYHIADNNLAYRKDAKLIYLDKHKYIPAGPNVKDFKNQHKNVCGKVIPNKFNNL